MARGTGAVGGAQARCRAGSTDAAAILTELNRIVEFLTWTEWMNEKPLGADIVDARETARRLWAAVDDQRLKDELAEIVELLTWTEWIQEKPLGADIVDAREIARRLHAELTRS